MYLVKATPDPSTRDPLARYRPWFYAAALYNLVWGTLNVLSPRLFFRLLRVCPRPKSYPTGR